MNATNTIEQCTNSLYNWLSQNGLALNPCKSEAIQFRTAQTRSDDCATVVNVAGENIVMSPSIKSLGVVLDSQLSFDNNVAAVMKACYFHMCALRHIRSSLPDEVAKMVACSITSSRLDYCNSLLVGMSENNFAKLQRLQNSLARVVIETTRYNHVKREVVHITPVLGQLH